jgi:hypothetical protein
MTLHAISQLLSSCDKLVHAVLTCHEVGVEGYVLPFLYACSVQLCQRRKTELLNSAFAGRKETKLGELTWDPAKAHDIFGPAAFDASGLLLQGNADVAAELQYTEELVQASACSWLRRKLY